MRGRRNENWMLEVLVSVAIATVDVAKLPRPGRFGTASLWLTLLMAVPVALLVACASFVPFRRLEADAYSRFGLDAASHGDVPSGFAYGRAAVKLAPFEEP